MPEETLFEFEQEMTTGDVADYLRTVADKLDGGEEFTLDAGGDSITLAPPGRVEFEVEPEGFVRARTIMLESARANEGILDRPGPTVVVEEVRESPVVAECRFWVPDPARASVERIRSEFSATVKSRLESEGIGTPPEDVDLSGEVSASGFDEVEGRS